MSSRTILTMAATAAAIGGGLAAAGPAAAATAAPATVPVPTAPTGSTVSALPTTASAMRPFAAPFTMPVGMPATALRPATAVRPVAWPVPHASEAAAPTGLLGLEDPLEIGSNLCVTPHWPTPLGADLVSAQDSCDRKRATADNGMHVLDDLCLAPVALDGPLGSGPAPSVPCDGPKARGPVTVLRDLSVAGVQVTY